MWLLLLAAALEADRLLLLFPHGQNQTHLESEAGLLRGIEEVGTLPLARAKEWKSL